MLLLEIAFQGIRGLPELYRLTLKKGLNVLQLPEAEHRGALLELFFNTLYPNSSRADATGRLAEPGAKKARVGITFYARDKQTYRLVRDVRLGSTALYRFDPAAKSFELLTDTAPDTAQYLRVQERLPDESDYEQVCMLSPAAMGSRGGRPKWRERGEVGVRLSEPSAPGLPDRGVSAMGFLQGGALMFETEETAMDRKPSGFAGFGGHRPASGAAPASPPALMVKSALETEEGEVSALSTSAFVFEQDEAQSDAEFEVSVAELLGRYEALKEELRLLRELEGAREEIDRLSREKLTLQSVAKETSELETKRADLKRRIAAQNPELLEFPDDAVEHVVAFRGAKKAKEQELGRFRKEYEDTEALLEEHEVRPLLKDPLFLGGVGFALLMWGLSIGLQVPFLVVLNLAGALAASGAVLRWVADEERAARLAAKLTAMQEREARIEQKFELETKEARVVLKERVNVDLENLIDDLEDLRRMKAELRQVEEALAVQTGSAATASAVEALKRVEQRINYLEARLLGSDESVSPAQEALKVERALSKLAQELKQRGQEVSPPPARLPEPPPAVAPGPTARGPSGSGEAAAIALPGSVASRAPLPRVVSGTPIPGGPVAPGRPVSGVAVVRGTTIPGTPAPGARRGGEDEPDGYGRSPGRGGSSPGGGFKTSGADRGWFAIGGGGISGFSSGGAPTGGGAGYGDGGGAPPETDRTSSMVLGAMGILQISVDELMERHGVRIDQYLSALARDLKTVRFDVRGTATFGTGAATGVRFGDKSELRLAELADPRGIRAEIALQLALIEVATAVSRVPVLVDDPMLDQDAATRGIFAKMLQYAGAVTQVLVLTPNADLLGGNVVQPLLD